jgi:hypothetical protein
MRLLVTDLGPKQQYYGEHVLRAGLGMQLSGKSLPTTLEALDLGLHICLGTKEPMPPLGCRETDCDTREGKRQL